MQNGGCCFIEHAFFQVGIYWIMLEGKERKSHLQV